MIDINKVKQEVHDKLKVLILLAFLFCPLYALVVAIIYFMATSMLGVKKSFFNTVAIIAAIGIVWNMMNGGELISTQYELVETWLFWPTNAQMILLILAFLIVVNLHDFLKSNYEDWMLKDEIQAEKKSIPEGVFDFEDRNHTTILGTTGAGKTSLEKQIAKYHIQNGQPMVIISGKSANGDPESLLEEVRAQCSANGQRLMVVSLTPGEEGTEAYNPLRRLEPETVVECLTTVSHFSEPHYEAHFKTWTLKVAQLIKYLGIEMSLNNLMILFDLDKFLEYAQKVYDRGTISEEQFERLIENAEENAKIAKDSKERFMQYLQTENVRKILTGKNMRCFGDVLKEGGVLFLDLHGPSYPGLTRDLATFAMADIATALNNDQNPSFRKVILLDELSFTFNSMLSSLYATARSTGAQIISATQSLADLDEVSPTLTEKLIENSNVYCIFRQNSANDAERTAAVLGTKCKVKRTQKADGIRYDPAGTSQVTREYKVHPDAIKEMPKLEYIYCNKDNGALKKVKITFY